MPPAPSLQLNKSRRDKHENGFNKKMWGDGDWVSDPDDKTDRNEILLTHRDIDLRLFLGASPCPSFGFPLPTSTAVTETVFSPEFRKSVAKDLTASFRIALAF